MSVDHSDVMLHVTSERHARRRVLVAGFGVALGFLERGEVSARNRKHKNRPSTWLHQHKDNPTQTPRKPRGRIAH